MLISKGPIWDSDRVSFRLGKSDMWRKFMCRVWMDGNNSGQMIGHGFRCATVCWEERTFLSGLESQVRGSCIVLYNSQSFCLLFTLLSSFETESLIAQSGLELLIFLFPSLECWVYKHKPPHTEKCFSFKFLQ